MYKLRAHLEFAEYGIHELIDAKLQRYRRRGYSDQWDFTSDELSTPLGLPLRIYVSINYKDRIQVDSADTTLLIDYMPTNGSSFELWLPTNERLHVLIHEPLREE